MLQSYEIIRNFATVEWKIIHLDETDSTNRWLKQHGDGSFCVNRHLHKKNRPLCVLADYQTAGRGCGTNSWESERGKNLLFSMLIHPTELAANEQFRITEIVSVALCQTIEHILSPLSPSDSSPILGKQVSIKWPNDIYVEDRKLCGILIENRLQGNHIKNSIIGIGLNVNQREFHSDAPNPVSLIQLTGHETDREALLHQFLCCFESVTSMVTVSNLYRNKLFQRRKQAEYCDAEGCFKATLVDVEPDGRLVLCDETGRERRYAFKEVQFLLR